MSSIALFAWLSTVQTPSVCRVVAFILLWLVQSRSSFYSYMQTQTHVRIRVHTLGTDGGTNIAFNNDQHYETVKNVSFL